MQEKPVEREQIVAKDLRTKRARPGKARMNEAKGSDIGNSLEMRRDKSRLEERDVQVPKERGRAYAS